MTEDSAGDVAAGLHRWATTREIIQQPSVWRNWGPRIDGTASDIRQWLERRAHDEIWFCGAGTSAFIGETLAAYLNSAAGPARFRAVPTTDLVACPRNFIRPGVKLLVVSFGRSGSSSESIGTLNLLAAHAPHADRLHITCNGDSVLARQSHSGPGELRTIVLPPETNDRGFAMTSSYTTMLLSALACFDPAPPLPVPTLFEQLAAAADTVIERGFEQFAVGEVPERAVFLGSGPLTGAARECALKVLELAAGKVTTSWDSTLGFRHGPKAITNASTRVFVLQSSDPYTRAYDADLAAEIAAQFGPKAVMSLGNAADGAEIAIPVVGNDAWSAPLHVIVGQILAVIWSDRLGNNVDNPFSGGTLTRVVAGVKLYEICPRLSRGPLGARDLQEQSSEQTQHAPAIRARHCRDRRRMETIGRAGTGHGRRSKPCARSARNLNLCPTPTHSMGDPRAAR